MEALNRYAETFDYYHFVGLNLYVKVDVTDPDVVDAARFAMQEGYKNDKSTNTYTVVRATKQLVNGLKFELTVEVTNPTNVCVVKQFGVWKRAGPPQTLLVENITLDQACGSVTASN